MFSFDLLADLFIRSFARSFVSSGRSLGTGCGVYDRLISLYALDLRCMGIILSFSFIFVFEIAFSISNLKSLLGTKKKVLSKLFMS